MLLALRRDAFIIHTVATINARKASPHANPFGSIYASTVSTEQPSIRARKHENCNENNAKAQPLPLRNKRAHTAGSRQMDQRGEVYTPTPQQRNARELPHCRKGSYCSRVLAGEMYSNRAQQRQGHAKNVGSFQISLKYYTFIS